MHYIYEISNLINGKTYIGQRKYRKESKPYMGSGLLVKKAIKKYGVSNFSKRILVDNVSTQEEADQFEIHFISESKKAGKAEYNIAKGGNLHTGWALSATEIRAKASASKKERIRLEGFTEKEKLQFENLKGPRIHRRGIKQSESWVKKRTEHRKGMPGHCFTKEERQRMSEGSKKKVVCVETQINYNSVEDAAHAIGLVNGSGISNVLHGKQNKSGGFHWEFIH